LLLLLLVLVVGGGDGVVLLPFLVWFWNCTAHILLLQQQLLQQPPSPPGLKIPHQIPTTIQIIALSTTTTTTYKNVHSIFFTTSKQASKHAIKQSSDAVVDLVGGSMKKKLPSLL
jgi:hypothetical protein